MTVPSLGLAARLGSMAPGALRAYLALALALLLWGPLQPVAKMALRNLEPAQFTFLRALTAGIALLVVCLLTGRGPALRREMARPGTVILLGVLAFTLSNHLSMAPLEVVSAGTNTVLAATSPLFTVIGMPLLGERPGLLGAVGALLGFVGIVVLARDFDMGSAALVGIAMSLAGAVAWAAYTICARRLAMDRDPIALTGLGALVGCLPLAVLAGPAHTLNTLASAPPESIVALLWCGIAGTAATYTLWAFALRHLPAARVAPTQYLLPPFGLLFAWLLLGEVPATSLLLGATLILVGVAAAQRARM